MFCIIGKKDVPLYETNLGIIKKEILLTHYFVLHSSLDLVEEQTFATNNMFLKSIDKTGEFFIYAFTTATSVRFLLLVDNIKNEDSIKNFFIDVYELLVKNMMNPLYNLYSEINSTGFDMRVKNLAAKYF